MKLIPIDACLGDIPIASDDWTAFMPSASRNDSTGIISIPVFSRSHVTGTWPTRKPPGDCNLPGSPVCEELSGSDCQKFSGCYVEWGPCQTVHDGFYSPPDVQGRQVPCPVIRPGQEYLPSSASRYCLRRCTDAESVVDISSGECVKVPLGQYMPDPACKPFLAVACLKPPGSVFTRPNSCEWRYITPAIGGLLVKGDIERSSVLTIQTWLKMDTSTFVTGRGYMCVYGVFGAAEVGFVSEGSEGFKMFLARGAFNLVNSSKITSWNGNQWNHIAVTVAEDLKVEFYVNGTVISETSLRESSSGNAVVTAAVFDASVANDLVGMLSRVHYGPFHLEKSQIITPNVFPWHIDVLPASVALELFLPSIHEGEQLSVPELGVFGPFPDGAADVKVAPKNSTPRICLPSRYFCWAQPEVCFETCPVNEVFNPISCVCEVLHVTTNQPEVTSSASPTPATTDTPIVLVRMSEIPPEQGWSDGVGIGLTTCVAVLLTCTTIYVYWIRRAVGIASTSSQWTDIAIPFNYNSDHPFANMMTFEEEFLH